jgi:hypothetical protein
MADLTQDVTLNNALAATTAGFWGREFIPEVGVYDQCPFFRLLRERNRIYTNDTFKTGVNIFDQSISDATEISGLQISSANEFFKMPTYVEYNLTGLNKKIVLTKEQARMLKNSLNIMKDQGRNDKRKIADVRKNCRDLRDKYMKLHFRKMYRNIDSSIISAGVATNCKSLHSVIVPGVGPNTAFSSDVSLNDLSIDINRPLWMGANDGTGATGLGFTLTGAATMNYVELLRSIAMIQNAQEARGGKYNVILCSPYVKARLAEMAMNRIMFTADPRMRIDVINPQATIEKGGLPLDTMNQVVIVNGLPVCADMNVTSNNVWLLDTDAISLEFFDDRAMTDEYYSDPQIRETEAIVRTYAAMTGVTLTQFNQVCVVAMVSFFQMAYDDFGGIGLVVFDSTSTT